jgi:periplasmic protein TonB
MEPKKNPKYDIHRQRGVLLNLGLAVSLILLIAAFKWKTKDDRIFMDPAYANDVREEILPDITPISQHTRTAVTQPKQIKASIPVPSPSAFVEVSNKLPVDVETPHIDLGEQNVDVNPRIEIPVEVVPVDTFFRVVEKMPQPVGGWEAFYGILKKNIHYPIKAQRDGIDGKVFVEFTVNDKGQLSNFKILKGIGYGCDEEASRVLALTKWTVGKQRGKPVNVRMVQPIHFNIPD